MVVDGGWWLMVATGWWVARSLTQRGRQSVVEASNALRVIHVADRCRNRHPARRCAGLGRVHSLHLLPRLEHVERRAQDRGRGPSGGAGDGGLLQAMAMAGSASLARVDRTGEGPRAGLPFVCHVCSVRTRTCGSQDARRNRGCSRGRQGGSMHDAAAAAAATATAWGHRDHLRGHGDFEPCAPTAV